ncbi:MAG TPA: enoyl-CoA hydratase/isomerase family protein [Stellaceae bacterium]|nr:enoyl-CoA hydratase/isomerase family protein [Stellaceae bacterium]
MSLSPILAARDARGVATLTLHRPALHNAFDENLIATLTAALRDLDADPEVRVVVLTGAGASFSAGADLAWMRRMASYGREENLRDAMALATMLATLDALGKPVIARVNGPAIAGGLGLVACCDIAIAVSSAMFGLTEVRLGLIPATIGPYVVAAIGSRAARRYFLTAERFPAAEAHRLGLLHEVVPEGELDRRVEAMIGHLLAGGAAAEARSKRLIAALRDRPIDAALIHHTAELIAEARASDEAREGLAAFFEKRKPRWHPG